MVNIRVPQWGNGETVALFHYADATRLGVSRKSSSSGEVVPVEKYGVGNFFFPWPFNFMWFTGRGVVCASALRTSWQLSLRMTSTYFLSTVCIALKRPQKADYVFFRDAKYNQL